MDGKEEDRGAGGKRKTVKEMLKTRGGKERIKETREGEKSSRGKSEAILRDDHLLAL